jgi:hypothetical protein
MADALKKVVEKNYDLLQNIEFSIIQVYREDPSLLDIDAKDAIDALVRHYHLLEEQKIPSEPRLAERPLRVFQSVQTVCEWRLGRTALGDETTPPDDAVSLSELVASLRQIQKSIPLWTKQGGRKGYLDFVSHYLP